MTSNNTRPEIGERVRYFPAASGGERTAVVVGYPEGNPDELHLAVLMSDGQRLDLLALSVPYSADSHYGTWSRHASADDEWPTTPNVADEPDPLSAAVGA